MLVTVTPTQSAFFAGELFSATITFSNPAPAERTLANSSSLNNLSQLAHQQTQAPPPPRFGQQVDSGSNGRYRSGLGGEGMMGHVESEQLGGPSTHHASLNAPGPSRPPTLSSYSGGALPTPHSAPFGQARAAASGPLPRSVSGATTLPSSPTSSKSSLPTRKGLIGKPLAPPNPPRGPAGVYLGGPRRPGARVHARSQSMAVSSPDLLPGSGSPDGERNGAGSPLKKVHGRSRLGGSMGGEMLHEVMQSPRKNGLREPVAPAIVEEPDSEPDSEGEGDFQQRLQTLEDEENPHRPSNHPYQHSQQEGEESTASLARSDGSDYDAADSNAHLPGRGFYSQGQNDTMDSFVQAGVEEYKRRALSSSSPSQLRHTQSTSSLSRGMLHPPNTLGLLWSFAHLEGTFEVDDQLIKPGEFQEVKRALLGGAAGMGGGTLGERRGKSGWRDWIWGGKPEQKGASLEDRKEKTLREKTVPTFSSPPSILGVDLVLEPGQSKSYSFTIRVPADMPPSFRGKSIKFVYHLVVGSNRSPVGTASFSPSVRGASSRVMRVPVRVYNHVAVTGARPFYDLTNPIIYHRDEATVRDADEGMVVPAVPRPRSQNDSGRADFESYAAALLDTVTPLSPTFTRHNVPLSPSLGKTQKSPTIMEAPPSLRPEMSSRSLGDHSLGLDPARLQAEVDDADGEGVGCKAAVEIVSRNSQKVSYDINKDGYMVASLTLVKSAYRLGETVNGSVVINSGDGRVLRVSARLETHELIETTVATLSAPEVRASTRRLHAEHHESTLDSARVGFALAIPSGATPDFATSGVKLQWSVRLSFLVIPPSPDAPVVQPASPAQRRIVGGPPGTPPNGMAAGSPSNSPANRHGRSKSFAYGFEPAVPLTLPPAPLTLPTGAAHLMPVLGPRDTSPHHTSYRGVPDLGFVPVLFSAKDGPPQPPSPGPLQRTAGGAQHMHKRAESSVAQQAQLAQKASVVLVPAKVDTVECSIPIRCFPGNTPFRPTVTVFEA